MFSLPYILSDQLFMTQDAMNIKFNHLNCSIDELESILFSRANLILLFPMLVRWFVIFFISNKLLINQEVNNYSVLCFGEIGITSQLVSSTYAWFTYIQRLQVLLIKSKESTRVLHSLDEFTNYSTWSLARYSIALISCIEHLILCQSGYVLI